MEVLCLPDTAEQYITKLQSCGDLQLSFKIIDNIHRKTLVLSWKNIGNTVVPESQPTVTYSHSTSKSPGQLARDKRRRARYQQTRKQAKQNKLSQQQNADVPGKPDTPPRPMPQEQSVLSDNAAVGVTSSTSLESSKKESVKPASRTNPTLELPGSVIKTRSMTRSTASISTTPRDT